MIGADEVWQYFHGPLAPQYRGRHWFGLDELEFHHDYIQWLFPLPEPSGANASAPLLSSQDIAAFKSDDALQNALLRSFALMLQFYGLDRVERGDAVEIVRGARFAERSREWLTSGNHNFLRISRILRSLSLLGLRKYAAAFLDALESIYTQNARIIGETTMGYWRRAVEPQRHIRD